MEATETNLETKSVDMVAGGCTGSKTKVNSRDDGQSSVYLRVCTIVGRIQHKVQYLCVVVD